MYPKRCGIAGILLALLWTSGCHKPWRQNANARDSPDQTTATHFDANAPAPDNRARPSALPGSSAAPATQAENEAPAKLIIPAGTPITVRLQQQVSSASAVAGERFEAVIDRPVVVGDQIVVPVGAPVEGHVTIVRRSSRSQQPAKLALTLDRVIVDLQIISLTTSRVVARGRSHKKRNWRWIAGGSGGGAVSGDLAAGGKGPRIGSGIGATTAFSAGKTDVVFGNERRLRFRVTQDVSLFG